MSWVSAETNLARSWAESGPPVLWTIEVGAGFGGAAVQRKEVFFLDRPNNQQDVLRCLDLQSGKEVWRFAYDAAGSLPFNGSRNVPTVNDAFVFAVSPFGLLHSVNRESHKAVWKHHLVEEFKDPAVDVEEPARNREDTLVRAQVPMWGLTQAPLLYHDLVIVAPQTRAVGLVAYEVATGRVRWKSGYVGRNWYSHTSPYLARIAKVDQIILLAQPSDPEKAPSDAPPAIISSIDPLTGNILWTNQTPGPYKIPIPEPLAIGDDTLFISGGYGLGCFALKVAHAESTWNTSVLFHSRIAAAHIQSPILYRDRIYLTSFKEHGAKSTGLVCLRRDGSLVWQTGPSEQFDSGAYLIADGKIFILNGKAGELSLYQLSEDGPQLRGRSKVLDAKGGQAWAPMALSEGKLVIRDQHQMKCLDVKSDDPDRAGPPGAALTR